MAFDKELHIANHGDSHDDMERAYASGDAEETSINPPDMFEQPAEAADDEVRYPDLEWAAEQIAVLNRSFDDNTTDSDNQKQGQGE